MPKTIKPQYKPENLKQELGYLVPELSPSKQEMNGAWIMRELIDLKRAIQLLENALILEGYHAKDNKR